MDIILISIPKTLVSRPPIIKIIVDLINDGRNIDVNIYHKNDYVDAMINYIVDKSIHD